MPYSSLKATLYGSVFQAVLDFGGRLGLKASLPQFPNASFDLGTGLGKVNLLGYQEGTATAAPATIDLKATTDPGGSPINFARVRYFLALNYSVTDGHVLKLDGTVANAWLTPFDSIATAKLVIPPGRTVNSEAVPGVLLLGGPNTTGLITGASNKVVSLDPGANTIPWRVALLGVDA